MKLKHPGIVWIFFIIVTLEAIFAVPFLSWEVAVGNARLWGGWFALLALIAICAAVWFGLDRWRALFASLGSKLDDRAAHRAFWFSLILGTILRILWVWIYPAPQHSDQAVYFGLATSLLEHHRYSLPQIGLAYWPPGYPFFLSTWILMFGAKTWLPLLTNLVLFAASLLVIRQISFRIGGAPAACMSTALFALWPTMIMTAGQASKEMLVLFLICALLLVYFRAQDAEWTLSGIGFAFLAGILIASASLTQPSLLLFPSVLVLSEWFRGQRITHAIGRLFIVGLIMVLMIFPWTLRNHRVLGAWVPISTNGGDVFYRANNPLATGGYTPSGEQNLDSLDEVQRSKVGFRLGKQWIVQHPGRFLALAVRKQILFLGDDAQGAFETLKRGLGIVGIRYLAWKGIANIFWWAIWILILVTLAKNWHGNLISDPLLASLMLGILYLFAMHSIFESGSKYHEPLTGLIAIVAAQVVAIAPKDQAGPERARATS